MSFFSLCVVWLDFSLFTARFGKEVQPASPQSSHMYLGTLGTYSTVFPHQSCTTVNGLPMPAFPCPWLAFPSLPPLHATVVDACLLIKVRSLKSVQSVQLPCAVRCHAMGDALANHNAHAGIILTQQNIPPTGTLCQHSPALTSSRQALTNNRSVCCQRPALGWDPPCVRLQKVRSCPVVTHSLGDMLAC